MKKKATKRTAKATSRQSTLNFPTSSDPDVIAESAAAVTSTKSRAKKRRKQLTVVKTKSRSEEQSIKAGRPSWSNLPLSDLVHSIDQGWSPRCENFAASSHSEWAVIKTTAIQNLQFLDQENKALPATLAPRKHLELRPDDLLITRAGPRNRVGVACLVRSIRPRLILCDKAYRLKCKLDVVEPAFLELALNSPDLVSQVNKLKTGISDSGVNITQTPFMNLAIPLPPLPEQQRIVAEIEKQFTRLDAGVAALMRVRANLKHYRAAVLLAACEGKLVPTEAEMRRTADIADKEMRLSASSAKSAVKTPPFETGEQLLQRILTERRQNWQGRGRYTEPAAPDVTELPGIPDGWAWASVEQLGDVQLGRQRSPKNVAKNYPTKYIRAANITERGIDVSDVLEMEFSPVERERFALRDGDIVLSEASGSPSQVGKPAIWRNELPLCCFQNTVLRLRAVVAASRFVLLAFQHCYMNGVFAKVAGGVGINHLGAEKFSAVPFPLPPLAEQTRIVAEVERRLSVVDELESVVSANLQRAARLRQSILQKAFTGELTGEDSRNHGEQVQPRRN